MKKFYLLSVALFCAAAFGHAQNAAAWLKQGELLRNPLVKAKFDYSTLSEKVALGADGSVYRAGEFIKSFPFNGTTVAGFSGGSTYILKYGANGSPVWGTSILGEATPTAMVSDGEGGVIVVGSYSGIYIHCKSVDGTKVVVDGVEGSSGKIYTFVVRYNAQGNVVFAKGFLAKPTSVDNDYEPHISLNNLAVSMGKVYCTGIFLGTATIGGVEYKSGVYDFFGSPASNPDGLVLALDMASGDVAKVIPFKTYGDLFSWSSYNSIAFDAIGNFYLAGYVRGKAKVEGATNGYELPSNDFMGVAKGLVVASYTASGDYRWSKCFPMQLTAVYEQSLIDPDGIAIKDNEVVVLGRVASTLKLSETINITASDAVKSDYFLAGFSTTDGTPAWASAFGTANDEVKAKMFSQGNAVSIAGSYAGAFSYIGNTLATSVSDSLDCFVASVEGDGALRRFVSTGGLDHDVITDISSNGISAYYTGIFRGNGNLFGTAVSSTVSEGKPVFDWFLTQVNSINHVSPAYMQVISENENGNTISVTEPVVATSRQWLYTTTSGSGYQSFANAETGTSYTPKFSSAGTYYVVCESTVNGTAVSSNEVKILVAKTVNSIAPVGVQNLKETQSGSGILVTEAAPATSRRWMYASISRSGYLPIVPAETGLTYTPKFSSEGTYFVVCESTVNGSVGFSNEVKVVVAKVNSIAPIAVQNIKENQNGAKLTVTEPTAATSRQWMYSTTSGSGYLPFATAEIGTTYTPKFATAGVYYVVCESTVDGFTGHSNEVRVTVSKINSIAPATAQSIKENENGATLTVTEPTAATSRRWMYSTTSGSGYQPFATAETGTTYTPKFATAGVYYVVCESVVDGITGISNEVVVTVSKATAIDDVLGQKFSLYPNPSNGQVTFSFPERGGKLEIVDLNGRVVYAATVSELTTTIDLALGSGIYVAKLTSNGNASNVKMVIR